jgi:hypothetical protein
MKSQLYILCLLLLLCLQHDIAAQQFDGSTNSPSLIVSTAMPLKTKQLPESASALMRTVSWDAQRGLHYTCLVVWVPGAKQVLVAGADSTNRIYWAHGQLFEVRPGIQSLWLTSSRLYDALDISEDEAKSWVIEGVLTNNTKRALTRRRIILTSLLENEAEERKLANPMFIRTADLIESGTDLLLHFESYTGKRGHVVLDRGLNVLQMTLD